MMRRSAVYNPSLLLTPQRARSASNAIRESGVQLS